MSTNDVHTGQVRQHWLHGPLLVGEKYIGESGKWTGRWWASVGSQVGWTQGSGPASGRAYLYTTGELRRAPLVTDAAEGDS